MSEQGVIITETDYGTKGKAKKAIRRTPRKGTEEGRRMLDKWWDAVLQDAIRLCPKKTGALSRTIRIEKIPKGSMIGGVGGAPWAKAVGPQSELINKMIVAGGKMDAMTGIFVDYAMAVHDGYVHAKSGRWHVGVPFLSDALAFHSAELDAILKKIADRMKEEFGRD